MKIVQNTDLRMLWQSLEGYRENRNVNDFWGWGTKKKYEEFRSHCLPFDIVRTVYLVYLPPIQTSLKEN